MIFQRRKSFAAARRVAPALALAASVLLSAPLLLAGGPNNLLAPGAPLTWDPAQPVNFIIDNGPLRTSVFTRDQGAELVRTVLQAWEDVETATITFEDRGFLAENVNGTNFRMYLNQVRPEGNPIVFDENGAITDEIFGQGQSAFVLGFATAFVLSNQDVYYRYGFAVLNGLQASLSPFSDFAKTVLHELGHMIGLDHTQAGLDQFFGGPRAVVPIMFPFIATGGTATPRTDDVAWLSFLYPSPDFRTVTATVRGVVRRRTGGPFFGSNVVLEPVTIQGDGSIQRNRNNFVSVVSDFLVTSDGSYELPGVPPGNYVLFIEALQAQFVEGSGIGPYEFRFTDFPRDFYNEGNESGDPDLDDPLQMTVLSLSAGQTLEGIDMVSNESINQLDTLGDDDEELFLFAEGFAFPFFGKVYNAITVNSDGNLTFDRGDSSSDARDQDRFLGGPPRIAPLFTDLNPEQSGSITAELDENSITFHWTEVQEFAISPPAPTPENTNTFSVTLFDNGDILFHYDNVSVTPDGMLQAIVGLSPGGVQAIAPTTDFSAVGGPFEIGAEAIYEVFNGTSFDLTGVDILFQAAGSQFFLFFPLNQADPTTFTGFAITNDGDSPAVLTVEGLTAGGQLQPYPDNPHIEALGAGEQLARLGSDFFGLTTNDPQDGWVRIGSTSTDLASFFQFGNGLGGTVTRLDGSTAATELSNTLYFTRLYDGAGSFPASAGSQTAETIIALANPNDELGVTVSLRLFDAAGNPVGAAVERVLPVNGCLRESLSSLFGAGVVSNGFVKADISGTGAVGFVLVELEDTLLGFNASPGNDQMVSYSAQLANGNAGGISIFTSLKLVNVSAAARTVTLTPLAENGTALAAAFQVTLDPNQSFQRDLGDLFGLGPADGPPSAGSLRVEANGPGVIGDVVFGDPQSVRYAAALPLQSRLLRRAIFSQVANASGNSLAARTFTGVAFHNPGGATAEISVRVFRANGAETGAAMISLPGGNRISTVLADLIPATAGQAGGFIVIESTQPVVAQQLFGNFSLDFLSAVPPTVFN